MLIVSFICFQVGPASKNYGHLKVPDPHIEVHFMRDWVTSSISTVVEMFRF